VRTARALRCLERTWDPDATGDTFVVEYSFLLRGGDGVKAAHDRHVEGLFTRTTWLRVLASSGYRVETIERPPGEGQIDEIFLCRAP
jgi:hypothetical protein